MFCGHVLASVCLALCCIVVRAELTCKGVEYSISGFTIAQPIDECQGTRIESGGQVIEFGYWYYCTLGGDVWLATYSTQDCSGDPVSQAAFSDTYAFIPGFSMTAYCNLPPCDYVTLRSSVSATSCDAETDPLSVYSSTSLVANHCSTLISTAAIALPDYSTGGGVRIECSNGVGVVAYYSDSGCSGVATSTQTLDVSDEFTCEQSPYGISYAMSIECGSATFAGLLTDQNSDGANPVTQSAANHMCLLHVFLTVCMAVVSTNLV